MKKGFTLIELLTVMMIMGLMGTIAVGGYRAFQRGMEERGVMANVNTMIRAAYQRAQIDRQPTAVFFWNETIRARTDDDNEKVIGRAVAVRRHGRLSNVKGQLLVDEFNDLDQGYPTAGEDDGNSNTKNDGFCIYPMDNLNDIASANAIKRSTVNAKVQPADENLIFLSGETGLSSGTDSSSANSVPAWAFKIEDKGNVDWKPGMAYGFEFISLTLPDGYIFGSDYSSSIESPVRTVGSLVFKPGVNSGGGRNTGGTVGRKTITVSSLRQKGSTLERQSIGESDSPEDKLD